MTDLALRKVSKGKHGCIVSKRDVPDILATDSAFVRSSEVVVSENDHSHLCGRTGGIYACGIVTPAAELRRG
jgi:hypothetical protein